jgi:fatty-acid peroxygenase
MTRAVLLAMPVIPRDPAIDSTLSIVREGYEFIWNRCRRFGSDVFLTRVFGKRAICIHGTEAAAVFYDPSKFERHGALPRRVITSLFGKRAVHTLDHDAHRQRKAAFMSLMSQSRLDELIRQSARQWKRVIAHWPFAREVSLFDEARRVLTLSACMWAGVPLATTEVERRACDLAHMIDAFGGIGPRLWQGKLARMRTERWMTRLVIAVRDGRLVPDPQSALAVMARLPGLDGAPLDARTAAIEVINVIRPTVAIAWYVAFAALALHQYPAVAERLAAATALAGPDGAPIEYADWFMQEVRRFYPFTPYLGAKVSTPFSWRGCTFERGDLVLLDVYGTNHDPKIWDAPDEFRPERFAQWVDQPFELIPQGGGDRNTGHRCPGEWITMHEVALALHFLSRCISYQLPEQDLGFDLARMPTRPRSGVLLGNVRIEPALDAEPPLLPSLTARREAAVGSASGDAVSDRIPPSTPIDGAAMRVDVTGSGSVGAAGDHRIGS